MSSATGNHRGQPHLWSTRWLSVLGLGALLCAVSSAASAQEPRFVPQLGLTSLNPLKVAFHPRDGSLLLVVSGRERIDLFDLANPDRPVKAAEFTGRPVDAAFNPAGDRIVSGSADGTVRLWTLDGQAAAAPFEGHQRSVESVAFNPAGDRIVSGSADGTVRLWTLDGQAAAAPFEGHQDYVRSVAFNPAGDRIVSGSDDGTVRLWMLDGQAAAAPFEGHQGSVRSVAFNPAGDRIVSGSDDGTVRLWMLDGQAAAAPFEGHQGSVRSVAFNPAGDRIVSGSQDGTVRLWDIGTGINRMVVPTCAGDEVEPVRDGVWAVRCSDRVVMLDAAFEETGVLFLHRDGLIVLTQRGVLAPTVDLFNLVRAFGEDGTMLTRIGAVPALSVDRMRQMLFNEYSSWQRVTNLTAEAWQRTNTFYAGLGRLKTLFWPALGWALVALSALTLWLFAPARLAVMAMPAAEAPPSPPWRWLVGVITLYGWLGALRRPLRAWLRRHRLALSQSAFLDRQPVRERERYVPLGHDAEMDQFAADLNGRAVCWIDGSGGSGKSALAFQLARTRLVPNPKAPLPLLIDADWGGSLAAEVARQLRLGAAGGLADREPSEAMARTLGAMGLLCPVVDSLSKRRVEGAVELVSNAVRNGSFRHLIVTSRSAPPRGRPWENQRRFQPRAIQREDLPPFIHTYAAGIAGDDGNRSSGVSLGQIHERIDPLVRHDPLPSSPWRKV